MTIASVKRWRLAWEQASLLKTPAERRAALEVFLKAPFEIVLTLSGKNRRLINRSRGALSVGEFREYVFAARQKIGVLEDVIHIQGRQGRRRFEIEQILICHKAIVGLVPNGCYLVRELVLAAAGSLGGGRVVNVNEYLGGCNPDFSSGFKATLPRLKTYKFRGHPVRCAWTTRGLHLRSWAQRLSTNNGSLLPTLKELTDTFWWTEATEEIQSKIRSELNPFLLPHLSSSDPSIKDQALWAWRTLNANAPIESVAWPSS